MGDSRRGKGVGPRQGRVLGRALRGRSEAGAELYEPREDAEIAPEIETSPVRADYVAFHTKALVFDRSKVLVGSLDLDPFSPLPLESQL